MKEIIVADIMTRDPITIEPDANLLECSKKMVSKKVGSLLITEGKKLIGFISQQDILWALVKKSKEDLSKIKAVDISPKKIITIKPSATVKETIKRMNKNKFDKLPVISEGELVGMITIKDILLFHPEYYPEIEELAKIREESKKLERVKIARGKYEEEGICEECGNRDFLIHHNGTFICESCKNSI
ncbi:MAG: CBS domain-containing protein [archaeon]